MAQFPDSLQTKIAFLHSLGFSPTEATQNWYETLYKSSHNLTSKELWLDNIDYAIDQNYIDNIFIPNNPTVIKKWSQVQLTEVFGSNGQSWYFNSGGTFIRPWISPVDVPNTTTNEPSFGFQIILYDNSNQVIGTTSSNWIVDYYAGMIKFAPGYTPVAPIKATFYQYTGRFGNLIQSSRFLILDTELDRLNLLDRLEGIIVYVKQSDLTYQLVGGTDNSNWIQLYTKESVQLLATTHNNIQALLTQSGITNNGNLTCNIPLSGNIIPNSNIDVYINGFKVYCSNDSNSDCFFAPNSGNNQLAINARVKGSEQNGDLLYWRENNQYQLDITDIIDITYLVNK